MTTPIRLLVGLGNPGAAYQLTRHNIGANWLRALALRFDITLKHDRTKRAEVGRGLLLGHDVRLLIPTTYMNQSGEAIGPFLRYFRIDADEMLVAFDDVAFDVGQTRLKFGGGPGGHNGLRSLISHLSGDRDFGRLRIGVGHPGSSRDLVPFLTQVKMSELDRQHALESSYLDDELLVWLFTGDWQKAMTKLNSVPNDEV
ncbi:MAG: aminoacyl-tRNA hydrolase [Gammaproteobacteria bacterium]|nr:aminoacyl-tRNA hydrolase [Gammaproteobacteria bacterium]